MADIISEAVHGPFPSLPSDASFLSATTPPTDADASSNVASMSSTPPTSASPDNISLASEPGIAKFITATTSVLKERLLPSPSPELREDAMPLGQAQLPDTRSKQQQLLEHRELQTEQHVEAPAPALDLTDAVEQLQREIEAQQQLETGTESGDITPAASAIVVADGPRPVSESPSTTPQRPRRARASLPVYNISKLAGTDIHGRRRAKGDDVRTKPKRRVSAGDALIANAAASSSTERIANELVGDAINALNMDWSVSAPTTPKGAKIAKRKSGGLQEPKQEIVTRRATRLSGIQVPTAVTSALTSIGKRGKKAAGQGLVKISLELKRLQDTKEFAHVDDRPIIETVWSKGKFVDPRTLNAPPEPRAPKRVKTTHASEPDADESSQAAAEDAVVPAEPEEEVPQKKRISKKWLDRGLYAGQATPKHPSVGLTTAEKRRLAQFPELSKRPEKGRDFKLPYDICNPLPPGHPKPPAYRNMTKNRFVGDASAYWKKQPHLNDFQSKCVCKPEDGCTEDCQNRIMLYECDETNCNIGVEHCHNRAFQSLQARTKQGGRYRVGVEVFKTEGKGYGVRSNRCFRPHQIIMEYTGEIITEDECVRRMEEIYKDNECYYLMSFDQNMIIDATTGSIARFVNHSCSPNCRMIKWIVGGQPRMALFAGDRPIMTGEELTYDYNFDPFSAKNVQKCLCGSDNCRGFLGPKPREVKPPKVVAAVEPKKGGAKSAKRKLKDLDEDDVHDIDQSSSPKSVKKRKIAAAKGAASSLSKAGLKVAKGAASALKRSMSSISVSAKAALASKKTSSPLRRVSTGGIVKKASPGKATAAEKAKITTTKAALSALLATGSLPVKKGGKLTAAPNSSSVSLTIVAAAPKPKTKTKTALSATTGNAKVKPKSPASATKGKKSPVKPKSPASAAKGKKTPIKPRSPISAAKGKRSPATTKRTPPKAGTTKKAPATKAKHSGYTPPSSPGPDDTGSPALKLSARKKVPSRKILESTVAGTASVTKAKAKPRAQTKSKLAAVAKKKGFMAAVRKAVKASSSASASASALASSPVTVGAGKGKGKASRAAKGSSTENGSVNGPAQVDAKKSASSPVARGSIEAASRSVAGFNAVNSHRAGARTSPEKEPREALDLPRVDAQIRRVVEA